MRLLAFLLLVSLGFAFVQESPLHLDLQRFLVVQVQESDEVVERLLPALELQPGDVMVESLTAANVSDGSLEGLVLVVPVAFATAYLDDSATELHIRDTIVQPEFSFDMGQTFGRPPLVRTIVVVEDGMAQEREVVVLPEEYTHVRWVIPSLPPEESVIVSFRAVVK